MELGQHSLILQGIYTHNLHVAVLMNYSEGQSKETYSDIADVNMTDSLFSIHSPLLVTSEPSGSWTPPTLDHWYWMDSESSRSRVQERMMVSPDVASTVSFSPFSPLTIIIPGRQGGEGGEEVEKLEIVCGGYTCAKHCGD